MLVGEEGARANTNAVTLGVGSAAASPNPAFKEPAEAEAETGADAEVPAEAEPSSEVKAEARVEAKEEAEAKPMSKATAAEAEVEGEADEDSTLGQALKAGKYGMEVCGVGLGLLLKHQISQEAEQFQRLAAFEALGSALDKLPAAHLAMLGKLRRAPPEVLALLIPIRLILRHSLAPPVDSNLCPEDLWPAMSEMLLEEDGEQLLHNLRGFTPNTLDPESIELIEPFLATITFAQIRKTVGTFSNLWLWISAVGVIGTSAYALLPEEMTASPSMNRGASPTAARPAYSPNALHRELNRQVAEFDTPGSATAELPRSNSRPPQGFICPSGTPASPAPPFLSAKMRSMSYESPPLILNRSSSRKVVLSPTRQRSDELADVPIALKTGRPFARHAPDAGDAAVVAADADVHGADAVGVSAHGDAAASGGRALCPPAFESLRPFKFLGAGNFANVFMCRDVQTGRCYALKSLLKALVIQSKKQNHVMSEREALEVAQHPCIIELIATYSDSQHLYLLMELALGGELFQLMSHVGAFSEPKARFYAGSLTLALGHLHSLGYMYRDVKPENLLLTRDGRLKLCDLGLAKRAEVGWTLVGTPEYTAPEVIRGEGSTAGVDWWQLGVLLFELVSTQLPFNSPDGTDRGLFVHIIRGEYEWPNLDLDEYQEQVCAGAAAGGGGGADDSGCDGSDGAEVEFEADNGCCMRKRTEQLEDLVAGLLRPKGSARSSKAVPPEAPIRLGGGPRGTAEVMEHPWWDGLDWAKLERGELPPPFIPELLSDDDDTNFGPLASRGEPVLDSPDYDNCKWDVFFQGW